MPSSDGWKLKKGSSKERREPRAAKPKTKTSETLAHEEGVDPDPQLAEARVVDAGEQVHPDQAEHAVDRLAIDVIARVARHVVLGRLAEREDAEGDQAEGGEAEAGVHVRQAEALGDPRPQGEGLRPGATGSGRVHQPVPSSGDSASWESRSAK